MLHHRQAEHYVKSTDTFRTEMLGIKQRIVSLDNNEVIRNQQKISLLEEKETIDAPLLQQISAALKIPVEGIQNFDEERAENIIANMFGDNACVGNPNSTFNFNHIAELKKLNEEKITLYERMIKEKDEMMGKLKKLVERK